MTTFEIVRQGQGSVALHGDLDYGTAPAVRQLADDMVVREVDLSGVMFIDSAGVLAVMSLNEAARHRGDALVVTHARPHVRRVFEMLDIGSVLAPDAERSQARGTRTRWIQRWLPRSGPGNG